MTDTSTIVLNIIYGIGAADQATGMSTTLTDITQVDEPKVVFTAENETAPASPGKYRINLDKSAIAIGNEFEATVCIETHSGAIYQDTRTFSLSVDADEHVFGMKLSRR